MEKKDLCVGMEVIIHPDLRRAFGKTAVIHSLDATEPGYANHDELVTLRLTDTKHGTTAELRRYPLLLVVFSLNNFSIDPAWLKRQDDEFKAYIKMLSKRRLYGRKLQF